MINDKFSPIHLLQRKIVTPLFNNAIEACSQPLKAGQVAKYIVIKSDVVMDEGLFYRASVAPAFLCEGKTYIRMEGECLWEYFLARKASDFVLPEEEVWRMMQQVVKALVELRKSGYQHRHIKQYAIRRVNKDTFRLIYHPQMVAAQKLVSKQLKPWYKFYFAPEQLGNFKRQQITSCVFSLGALILNVMNPHDFKRDIYSFDGFEINKVYWEEKVNNALKVYSKGLVEIVVKMLEQDWKKRFSLVELLQQLTEKDPILKKNKQIIAFREMVSSRMAKSKEKRKSLPKQSLIENAINFQRGTFGGYRDQQNNNSINSSAAFGQTSPIQNHYTNSTNFKLISTQSVDDDPQLPSFNSDIKNSIIKVQEGEEKGENIVEFGMGQLNRRISQYHIQLAACLRPIEEIAKSIGCEGVRISGNIYFGGWVGGRRNGIGLQIFPNGQYYYGFFKDDLFHGQGFYFWSNRQHFLGQYQSGSKIQGSWLGRSRYIGQIKNNRRHGIGSCTYANGRVYQGQWFNGKYEGSGILSDPSGEKFIGTFRGGMKWGRGSFLSQNCRINGVWDGERPDGSVHIIYENGNSYLGFINQDFQKHGKGEYTFKNSANCKGIFENDQFVSGIIYYRNGERYQGQARDYKRHGRGTYYYNDGKIVQGLWDDGILTK